jgi:hypothetical protein
MLALVALLATSCGEREAFDQRYTSEADRLETRAQQLQNAVEARMAAANEAQAALAAGVESLAGSATNASGEGEAR